MPPKWGLVLGTQNENMGRLSHCRGLTTQGGRFFPPQFPSSDSDHSKARVKGSRKAHEDFLKEVTMNRVSGNVPWIALEHVVVQVRTWMNMAELGPS